MATHLTEMEISERGVYVIDVEEEEKCLLSLKEELDKASKKQTRAEPPHTIFRVPDRIRKIDPDAYDPTIISFGPYHHGKPQLQALDDLKMRYLHKILQRNPEVKLEKYYGELKGLESLARSSYSDDHKVLKSCEFVKMLLLDGCFIVQLLLMVPENSIQNVEGEEEDPMVDIKWALTMVGFDMLKLENQLPFFILEAIFGLATGPPDAGKSYTLPILAINFFSHLFPNKEVPSNKSLPNCCYHLLHRFHSCMKTIHQQERIGRVQLGLPRSGRSPSGSEENGPTEPLLNRPSEPDDTDRADPDDTSFVSSTDKRATELSVPCATELENAGVDFKKNKTAETFLDVKFRSALLCNGVMRIPQLDLHDNTNELLRNLIAFEQCFPEAHFYVTCYAFFMDRIIDTPSDVALLRRKGVISNSLGSDEDAAALFNKLCKGVLFDPEGSYLAELFIDVKKHCDSRMKKWRARLMRDYFSNPWSFLSLVAAFVILSLTIVGTVYTVRAYYHPPS